MNSNDTLRQNVTNRNDMASGNVDAGAVTDQLNTFLRGELSAVETYRMAIEKLQGTSTRGTGVALLNQLMASHAQRVQRLRDEVVRFGGKPDETSGAWGGFANLVQGAADLFGEKSAIAALEEGEDHGRKEYRDGVSKLDATSRQWIESTIYPEQQKTHRALSDFKKQLAAS